MWKGDTLCSPEKEAVFKKQYLHYCFFPDPLHHHFLLLDLNSFLFCPQSTHSYILFWLMFSLQKSRRFRSQLMADKLSAQHQTLETFGSMCSKWSLLTEKGTGDHCSPSNDEQCPPVLKERPCSVSPQVSLEGVRSFLLIHYTVIMVFKLVFISYEFRDGTFVSINLISQHLTVWAQSKIQVMVDYQIKKERCSSTV